ncbi:MAG TPA: Flp family type IVb pilin [Acidobacteriaceae bacterium]
MRKFVRQLLADDSGQDLIEYALIAALVGLGSVSATYGAAAAVNNTFGTIARAIHPRCAPGMSCVGGH